MLPLQIAAFAVVGPGVRRRMQESFLAGSRHQSRLVEAFGNAITVKALACEDVQVERFQETLSWSLLTGFRVAKLHIVNGAVGDILGNGSVILIIFFGSKLVLQNEITLGELIAFHLLADGACLGPIMSLSVCLGAVAGLEGREAAPRRFPERPGRDGHRATQFAYPRPATSQPEKPVFRLPAGPACHSRHVPRYRTSSPDDHCRRFRVSESPHWPS